jgi:LPXTG-site transpeptidase (sortase) family protein
MGDVFILEDTSGREWKYRVSSTELREAEDLYIRQLPDSISMLALITCYPFTAIFPGTSQRYIVLAERI